MVVSVQMRKRALNRSGRGSICTVIEEEQEGEKNMFSLTSRRWKFLFCSQCLLLPMMRTTQEEEEEEEAASTPLNRSTGVDAPVVAVATLSHWTHANEKQLAIAQSGRRLITAIFAVRQQKRPASSYPLLLSKHSTSASASTSKSKTTTTTSAPVLSILLLLLLLLPLTEVASSNQNDRQPVPTSSPSSQQNNGAKKQQTTQSPLPHVQHPSLFVDTKYWTRNTEFGDRDNWLDSKKPCTLLERIVLGLAAAGAADGANAATSDTNERLIANNDPLVVSMGDSFGLLDANAREIVLGQDGVLLLEEDQGPMDDSLDSAASFVQYLAEQGDCTEQHLLQQVADSTPAAFIFQPHPDDMSWFNPANWQSDLLDLDEIGRWAPQSHQIPCAEDVVVFGRKHAALWPILAGDERSSKLSFKVNFRSSYGYSTTSLNYEFNNNNNNNNNSNREKISSLRVSKLIIGQEMYTQVEFSKLLEQYGNGLFEFYSANNETLLDNLDYISSGGSWDSLPLIIDESSIQQRTTQNGDDLAANNPTSTSMPDLCLEEAGCLCGNEERSIMAAICSFNEPLKYPDDYPCLDPISSTGYCDKICGTVLSIQMNPSRFSERYVSDLLNKLLVENQQLAEQYGRHLFSGARRVDHAKFEITIRPVSNDRNEYEQSLGKDLEFALMLRAHLEQPATKSFYGIKSIRLVSSLRWRRNNSLVVFLITLFMLCPVILVAAYNEDKIKYIALLVYNSTIIDRLYGNHDRQARVGVGRCSTASLDPLWQAQSGYNQPDETILLEDSIGQSIDRHSIDLSDNDLQNSTLVTSTGHQGSDNSTIVANSNPFIDL